MVNRIEVPADEKLTKILSEMYGLALAKEALGGDKPTSTLPGFALAMALVDKAIADHRAQMAIAAYRCAAKLGHDVAKLANLYTSMKNGKYIIEMEDADLVEQAEG